MYWLGIDTGTGGTRAILIDRTGKEIVAVTAPHEEIRMEHPLWAEQRPEDWIEAAAQAIRGVLAKSGAISRDIRGVGLSGSTSAASPRSISSTRPSVRRRSSHRSPTPSSPASRSPSCSGCATTNQRPSTVCASCCSRRTTSASG